MDEIRTQSAARLLHQLSNRYFGQPKVGFAIHSGANRISASIAWNFPFPMASAYGCPRSGTGQNDDQRNEERRLNR
jgi:hypothetical protein